MYCLFSLLRLRSIDPENPFSEALWLSSRPKRAIGLARERTHAVNTLLHAWVTPASVRALGATKSTHSARVKSQAHARRRARAAQPRLRRERRVLLRVRPRGQRGSGLVPRPDGYVGRGRAGLSRLAAGARQRLRLRPRHASLGLHNNHFRNSPTSTFRACSYMTNVSTEDGKNLAQSGSQPRTNMRGPCCWYMSRAQTRGLGDADV